MKTNAIISALICFITALIVIPAAIAEGSFIGLVIGIGIALIGRNFYQSREII